MGTRLYVGNMSYSTTEASLRARVEEILRRYPEVRVMAANVGTGEGQIARLALTKLELARSERLLGDRAIARRDWDAIAFVGARIADGLEALHANGVAHGDLKPSNVLVTPDGALNGSAIFTSDIPHPKSAIESISS